MKLNFKLCSPFIIVIAATLFSCHKEDKKVPEKKTTNTLMASQAQDYLGKAEIAYSLQQFDQAFAYYNKAKESYIADADSIMAGYALTKMAGIQNLSADYSGSENTAVEALKFLEGKNDNGYLSAAYNILGISYKKLLNFDQSLYYYKKGINITDDPHFQCILKNNIASVNIEAGNYKTALPLLLDLNQSDVLTDYPDTKARVLNNLGLLYFRLHKTGALPYLNEALKIREQLHDAKDLISSYLNLSEFYKLQNKPLSKIYAQKAYRLAAKIKNTDDRLQALQILNSITSGSEYKHYSSKYMALMDSVNLLNLKAKSQFAAIKYSSKKAEEKLVAQKAKDELRKQSDYVEKVILFITVVLVSVIAILIIYIILLRNRKEKSVQVYKTETRMSKKVHDELANDVFKVMSFAETHDFSSPTQHQKLVQDLDSIYNKARDISRENNTIDTNEKYGAVLLEMLADYKTLNTNIMAVNFEMVDWARFAAQKKITIYRILQELMVNMKKYSQASIVAIKFTCDKNKLIIQYTDNGRGLSDEKLIYKNGLQNAETRIKSVNGSITFDSKPGEGLKATITVPI